MTSVDSESKAGAACEALAAGLTFFTRRLMQAALVMLAILIIAFAVRSALRRSLARDHGRGGT